MNAPVDFAERRGLREGSSPPKATGRAGQERDRLGLAPGKL